MSKIKNIDLRTNGTLFPSYVLHNFKEYKLPEVIINKDLDPCSVTEKKQLKKYQEFISAFFNYKSQYRNVLIYHGLGSGKTLTAINIINTIYSQSSDFNIFILIKASLLNDPWLKDMKDWLSKEDYAEKVRVIRFVHYDSPFADKDFFNATKEADSSKKNLYVIDEVHNFIRNVYTNMTSIGSKRAQNIYDYIFQDIRDNITSRIITISGTPIINTPFELSLLFNLLRPNVFPRSEAEFNSIFCTSTGSLNPAKKNLFQRRILGLVSYYIGSTPDTHATRMLEYIDLPMSSYQETIYEIYENMENKSGLNKKGKRSSKGMETYRPYTRQACNFVFPDISDKISGDQRPRPSNFRMSEEDALNIDFSKKKLNVTSNKKDEKNKYINALIFYMTELEKYLDKKNNSDIENNTTILNEYNRYKNDYNKDFKKFLKDKNKIKSSLLKTLTECSPKYSFIIFKILDSPGSCLVYSNYVNMEGFQTFKLYLKYIGFNNYSSNEKTLQYMEYHGGIDKNTRIANKKIFNSSENKYGDIIKVILISPTGAEGINLNNVRQVHIIEPYWNEVRISQMIGRSIRNCSHKDLPIKERHVEIFRYKCSRNSKETSDYHIEIIAKKKDSINHSFLVPVQEVAVDCELFKSHNMMSRDYKCFKFNEDTLFKKHIAPAYTDDIYDDAKLDDGSNSVNSITKKIRVMKIKAVVKLGEGKYSPDKFYWFYADSGVVYDFDLHFAVGKVEIDFTGNPTKLDKDTYIIDQVIPIPSISK